MRGFLMVMVALAAVISGCADSRKGRHTEQNFQPYLMQETYAFPMAYADESWAYPAGTSTQSIIDGWAQAGLILKATTQNTIRGIFSKKDEMLAIYVGPNFYNLSASSRRGLAVAVGQIYGVGQNGRDAYGLYDWRSGKPVGIYNLKNGLYTY